MKPGPFSYHRPESVEDALGLLAAIGDEAKILGGGQSLVPMLNLRLARPEALVDINEIGLDSIDVENDIVRLGTLVRHQTLEHDPIIAAEAPLLAVAAPLIGHPPIRVRGTLGGSIAHADAAAELPAVIVALDAVIHVRSASASRRITASEFFHGPFMTALDDDEMIVGIDVPRHGTYRCAYEEFAIRAGDFALVGATVAIKLGGDGTVDDARIALSGAGSVPVRAGEAEQALLGTRLDPSSIAAAGAEAAAAASPSSDIHGAEQYRRHLADVLTQRAIARAARNGGSVGATA